MITKKGHRKTQIEFMQQLPELEETLKRYTHIIREQDAEISKLRGKLIEIILLYKQDLATYEKLVTNRFKLLTKKNEKFIAASGSEN